MSPFFFFPNTHAFSCSSRRRIFRSRVPLTILVWVACKGYTQVETTTATKRGRASSRKQRGAGWGRLHFTLFQQHEANKRVLADHDALGIEAKHLLWRRFVLKQLLMSPFLFFFAVRPGQPDRIDISSMPPFAGRSCWQQDHAWSILSVFFASACR